MYGKVFDSIFDSTLVADGGWLPTYVFMSMISIADKDGFVEIAPRALYRRLGFNQDDLAFEKFEEAIKYLEQVDSHSNSKAHGGKRILPLSEMDDYEGNRGWFLVNYKSYRDKGSRDEKRRADRERIAAKRAKEKKSRKVSQKVADVAYTDTDTDIKIKDLFSSWQEIHKHPKALLDDKRKGILKKSLNTYGFEVCKKAIKGIGYSSFHMGDNEKSTVYDGLHVIFKDAHNVEKFSEMTKPDKSDNQGAKKSIKAEITHRLKQSPHDSYQWKNPEAEQAWMKIMKTCNLWQSNDYQINQALQEVL